MESVQHNAALAITGAIIRGTSREKFYQELDNSSTFSKYLKVNLRNISSEYFLELAKHIIQELMIRVPFSVVNIIFL